MKLYPKRIDDRGRAIKGQARPTRAEALASGADGDRVDAAIGRPTRDAALYGALLGLSFAGLPALGFAVLAVLPPVLGWPVIVAIVAGIVLLAIWLVRGTRKHLNPRAWLSLGLCPGCGYRITEIEPEADGCCVCPECAAAWKLDGSVEGSADGNSGGQG